ncbi:hypothetical protein GOBAR_AA30216 [Gossypium barbadense]|uniref:Uncharacterized protein n=1 Tax=Gossypium barbadense TaxID=3634 RepID=A0A2P5WH95_GOSBA|nr:hypothetical protein GOBAR_AA30216 [Gossypium barbadense]
MFRGRPHLGLKWKGSSTKTLFVNEGCSTHIARGHGKYFVNLATPPTTIFVQAVAIGFKDLFKGVRVVVEISIRTIIDLHESSNIAKADEDRALVVVGKWKAAKKKVSDDVKFWWD